MLDLELRAEFNNQGFVEVGTIVGDNPLMDAILTDKVILNEPGDNILGDGGK